MYPQAMKQYAIALEIDLKNTKFDIVLPGETSALIRADVRLFLKIFNNPGRAGMLKFMRFITRTGNGFLYPLIPLAALFFRPELAGYILLSGGVIFAVERTAYLATKHWIKRERPYQKFPAIHGHLIPGDQFSFPSGHTAAAVVAALLLGQIFPSLMPLFGIWVILVGYSRVYLGVHYPGDILAGLVLGYLSAQLGVAIIA